MNLFDVLFTAKPGTVKPGASMFDILFAQKLRGAAEKIVTILGNPLSFVTKKAQTALSTKLTFTPVQSGSGYPSPDNIRPITGRSGAVIKVADGESVVQDEITISFGEDVYGGTLNVETGELTVDTVKRMLNDPEKWIVPSDTTSCDVVYSQNFSDRKTYDTSAEGLICSVARISGGGVYIRGRWMGRNSYIFGFKNTTLEQVQSFAEDIEIAYILATPIIIQLTPEQVQLLKGANTVWVEDEGCVIELTYKE